MAIKKDKKTFPTKLIKHVVKHIHSPKMLGWGYVCVLYAIIPAFIAYCCAYTPCLNAFWHSDPYIFLHFVGNVFLSRFCEFFWSLIFSEDRQLHAAAANGEVGLNSTHFSRLWRKQPQKSTPGPAPDGEKRSCSLLRRRSTSLVPRRKA